MKKKSLFLFITIFSHSINAQNTYEEGYYINNFGKKIDCLIKNLDWDNNPTEFTYKMSENSEINRTSIRFVKEFGIKEISKYVRYYGNIDVTSNKAEDLTEKKEPTFKRKTLFLKVLVEGDANLYVYKDGNLTRYFYKTKKYDIEQLIYKLYLHSYYRNVISSNKIHENERYKEQLWNNLKCEDISMNTMEKLKYYKTELVNFFINYNKCINSEFTIHTKKRKDLFNFNIRPGINFYSIKLENSLSRQRIELKPNKAFRLAIETEIIMPFNNNKWAIIVEPTFQYLKSEEEVELHYQYTNYTETRNAVIDYKSLEIPFGFRYYMFLNKQSKLFINASYVAGLSFKSDIALLQTEGDISAGKHYKIGYRDNYALGFGYNFNDKLSTEVRVGFIGDLLPDYVYWFGEYQSTSLIFSYTLF